MTLDRAIDGFLAGQVFAVAGASSDRHKYGNKVLRCYWQHKHTAFPINPRRAEVEGARCYPDVASLPQVPHGLSIITPPDTTEFVVEEAGAAGVRYVWMQPGAESVAAVRKAEAAGMTVISGGPCLLVVLGYNDAWVPAG